MKVEPAVTLGDVDELTRLRFEKQAGEFWRDVFEEITDKTERQKIQDELTDYYFMLKQVPKVYMHVTGQKMSKPNYYAESVIYEADNHMQDCIDEALEDELEGIRCQ